MWRKVVHTKIVDANLQVFDQSQAVLIEGRERWSPRSILPDMRLKIEDIMAIEKGFANTIESLASLDDF